MKKEKAAQRTLEKRAGELWFGAKVAAVLPTPVPAVVLICTQEPPDPAYDATHYVKSTEHYVSSKELLLVATEGRCLTDDQVGTLLAALLGMRHALTTLVDVCTQAQYAPLVDRLRGTEDWHDALSYARYVLGRSPVNLDLNVATLVPEEEHA